MTSRQLRELFSSCLIWLTIMTSELFIDEGIRSRQLPIGWAYRGLSRYYTRPLKHMADDLGHASMGTTDQYIYSLI